MKYQFLFSLKNNENYSRLSSAAIMIGALRVNRLTVERKTDVFAHQHSFFSRVDMDGWMTFGCTSFSRVNQSY